MRIAIVTETWVPSINGVVTRLTRAVPPLVEAGHEVLVIAPAGGGTSYGGATVAAVPRLSLPFINPAQPWGLPLPEVGRRLEAFRPDLVHVVNPMVVGLAAVAFARSHRVPLVCSHHTRLAEYAHHYGFGFMTPAIWGALGFLHNTADLNLAASTAARRELEAHGVPRVEVWDPGVDLGMFMPRPPEPGPALSLRAPGRRLCLYVGRLAGEKGIRRLVPLAATNGFHLALAGDGPQSSELEALFGGTSATFLGPMLPCGVARAHAAADVLVHPSTTGTNGLVILEAMASGLPIVAADSVVAVELLRDYEGGWTFPADMPQLVPDVAATAIACSPNRAHLAAAARTKLRTWAQSTAQLLEHYRQAIRRSSAAEPAALTG